MYEPEMLESSPELSDSFEKQLERAKKEREAAKKKQQETATSDEEVFESASEEIFSDGSEEQSNSECAAIEKTMCDIDDTRPIRNLKIRDSLMLIFDRPSMNVTKTRPHYIVTDQTATPNKFDSSQNFLNSPVEYAANHSKVNSAENQASPSANNLNHVIDPNEAAKSPLLTIEQPRAQLKTPVKNLAKKDKFAHVKSPVAEYIHKAPHSPQVINAKKNLEVPSPRHNFRDSNIGVQDASNENEERVQSLPTRKLVRSTNVVEVK